MEWQSCVEPIKRMYKMTKNRNETKRFLMLLLYHSVLSRALELVEFLLGLRKQKDRRTMIIPSGSNYKLDFTQTKQHAARKFSCLFILLIRRACDR
jgi:hypothetical protein